MNRHRLLILTIGVSMGMLFLYLYFFVYRPGAPWLPSGQLVILVRTAPQSVHSDVSLGLGIDAMELFHEEGRGNRLTILTRRILLEPETHSLSLLLNTTVPAGRYSGLGFTIQSPELRNSWKEEEPPQHISLLQEHVTFEAPYTVREGETTVILLSFETAGSMYSKEGVFYYLPVIQVETRNGADVANLDKEHQVVVSGGTIEHSKTFGMDWDGTMKFNFRAKNISATQEPALAEMEIVGEEQQASSSLEIPEIQETGAEE